MPAQKKGSISWVIETPKAQDSNWNLMEINLIIVIIICISINTI